jgi:hypothetical protein
VSTRFGGVLTTTRQAAPPTDKLHVNPVGKLLHMLSLLLIDSGDVRFARIGVGEAVDGMMAAQAMTSVRIERSMPSRVQGYLNSTNSQYYWKGVRFASADRFQAPRTPAFRKDRSRRSSGRDDGSASDDERQDRTQHAGESAQGSGLTTTRQAAPPTDKLHVNPVGKLLHMLSLLLIPERRLRRNIEGNLVPTDPPTG